MTIKYCGLSEGGHRWRLITSCASLVGSNPSPATPDTYAGKRVVSAIGPARGHEWCVRVDFPVRLRYKNVFQLHYKRYGSAPGFHPGGRSSILRYCSEARKRAVNRLQRIAVLCSSSQKVAPIATGRLLPCGNSITAITPTCQVGYPCSTHGYRSIYFQ